MTTLKRMTLQTFDFLEDLYTANINTSPTNHVPLPSVLNTLDPLYPDGDICVTISPPCVIVEAALEMGDLSTLTAHVNERLQLLDIHLSSQGSHLALLTSSDDEECKNGKEGERGIFSQWTRYAQALVRRVAELEREGALMRNLLGGMHMTPSVRSERRRTAGGDGGVARELIFA